MTLLTDAMIKGLENADVPAGMIAGFRELQDQINNVMAGFRRECTKLKNSDVYSPSGREQKIAEAAHAAAESLLAIESSAHGYDDHIQQLEASLTPDSRPSDSTLAFLQEMEIRTRLADTDPLELQAMYQTACGNGGPGADLIAAALENDPLPRLSADVIQAGIEARGLRRNPDEARKLGQIKRVRSALRDALQEARGELQKNGLPADDWLMQVARGDQ